MENKELNVEAMIKRLPAGYEEASAETKALKRKRGVKTPQDLIKIVLLYLTGGYSQIEMSVLCKGMGIANMSDVAFLNRFAGCRDWLAWIIARIKPQPIIHYSVPKSLEEYKVVALDASDVSEKGRSRRVFRLHYAIELFELGSISYKITAQKVGETLSNFDIKPGWLILADRVYGTLTGIQHCLQAGGNFVLRLRHDAFKLYDENGEAIPLRNWLQTVTNEKAADKEVYVKLPILGFTRLRICAIRIPDDKLGKVDCRNKRRDSKKQQSTSADALFMSHYVVVITGLPLSITADEIISLYRLRWQIEIYFKRLKSIMDFGNVPLRREDSIYTWLNGKLLVALLIEQMISEVSFSP